MDLRHADLRGADLAGALRLEDVKFDRTKYSENTAFPAGFDPVRQTGLSTKTSFATPSLVVVVVVVAALLGVLVLRARRVE